MALTITLTTPGEVHPGERFPVSIEISPSSETAVDAIELLFDAFIFDPNRSSTLGHRGAIHRMIKLKGPMTIDRVLELTAEIEVPEDAPCTHNIGGGIVSYSLAVHVDIPWWPDRYESQPVSVVPRRLERPVQESFLSCCETGEHPQIEIALDDTAFAPGETISGAIALGNLCGASVWGVELSLVARERFLGIHNELLVTVGYVDGRSPVAGFDDSSFREGRPYPFHLAIPEDADPSFDTPNFTLQWELVARVDGDCPRVVQRVPFVLGAFDGTAVRDKDARPIVGAERWFRFFREVAKAHGLRSVSGKLAIEGRIAGCSIDIHVDEEGRKGTLEAILDFPSLGIALEVHPRGLLSRTIETGDLPFDRRYAVTGRDRKQIHEGLTPGLRAAILALDAVAMNDGRATVGSLRSAYDPRQLEAFVNGVETFAKEISAMARNLPPPTPMIAMLSAWKTCARSLGGTLDTGPMCIREGTLDGETIAVRSHYGDDPKPTHTTIELTLASPPLQQPDDSIAVYRSLREGARRVSVNEERIVVELEGCVEDPSTLHPRMSEMVALAKQIGVISKLGPYR